MTGPAPILPRPDCDPVEAMNAAACAGREAGWRVRYHQIYHEDQHSHYTLTIERGEHTAAIGRSENLALNFGGADAAMKRHFEQTREAL